VQELGARLAVTRQALHEALRPLVAGGFISMEPAADDRRRRLVALTPAGEALEASLSGAQRALLDEVLDALGPQAEAGWRAVMASLAGRLHAEVDGTLRLAEAGGPPEVRLPGGARPPRRP
jgi:DNA-binding MarR family transcriptional regulator